MILPPLTEVQEKPLKIAPEELAILQPKFDGCQAIFVPGAAGYQATTRSGQVITRLDAKCRELNALGCTDVYFTEFEPNPWTEDAKHQLAGNLYNQNVLPFGISLQVFDCLAPAAFWAGQMKNTACKPRLLLLDQQAELLLRAGMHVVPWQEMPYSAAKAICKTARIQTDEGTRCRILGHLVEGGIIRVGNKIEKDKAKVDKDIYILHAISSLKGQRGWIAVDTKQPDDKGLLIVFGGVTPKNHVSMVGKVVEVDILTVSGVEGGGNPTFKRDRSNEKEFDYAVFLRRHGADVTRFCQAYKACIICGAPEL